MDHCNAVVSWLTNINWSQVQWNQLWSFSDFHWVYGKTPFSQLQVPATVTFFYLITIFMLQKWMKDREAWSLKTFSLFHNLFLTLLSCAMVGGVLYGAFEKAGLLGPWSGLMCHQEADPMYGTLYYWSYIYYLSKIYELTDSYLLVLKKNHSYSCTCTTILWCHTLVGLVCKADGRWPCGLHVSRMGRSTF